MTFKQLGLLPQILSALKEQGYEHPTPIQHKAIPPALNGQDVLGCAQTGTGKTCAFATPILQRLFNTRKKGPRTIRALILTPTRELAIQIGECFAAYGKNLPLRSAVIFGGVGQKNQVDQIKRGLDILVATPGRLLDLHGQGLIDLLDVEIFVLDEADRMLDMGFIHDVRRVIKLLPEKKQTLFFSATMPPEVMDLVNALLHDYARVEVDPVSSPVEVIEQKVYFVDKGNKTKLLAHLIDEKRMDSVLVFSRTKHGANRIVQDLIKKGITAAAIHGNKSQTARQQALADFKAGKLTALVATDIAARGIDIDELNWVVNYDLPEVPETYIHRIGRTGRAGRNGSAISFCRADEKAYLKAIEKLLGRKLPVVEGHPYPMVEAPTGVDPMVQARREGKENARQRAAERRQAQEGKQLPKQETPKPLQQKKPVGKKQTEKHQSKAKPAQVPAGKKPEQKGPEKKSAPKQEKKQEAKGQQAVKPVQHAQKEQPTAKEQPKRGMRQQRLEDTMPAKPEKANSNFVRVDPLAGDCVMDATARLLAPKPRAVQQKPTAVSEAKKKTPAPVKQELRKQQTKQQSTKQPPKNQKKNQSPAQNKKTASVKQRNDRTRPVEAPRTRVKDSTEQHSLMKPYYLHDD